MTHPLPGVKAELVAALSVNLPHVDIYYGRVVEAAARSSAVSVYGGMSAVAERYIGGRELDEWTIEVDCYSGGEGRDPAQAEQGAYDLVEQVIRTIEADRTIGGLVESAQVESTMLEELGVEPFSAQVTLGITFYLPRYQP